MRTLICGGREYTNLARSTEVLNKSKITLVIEGGAAGADRLGRMWAYSNKIPVLTFQADWKQFGKAAGAIRNQEMIDKGKPDQIIAFPGGRGTADMIRRGYNHNVPVIEIPCD